MEQIIRLFLKRKVFVSYLFLAIISFIFIIDGHTYHKSKLFNSANFFSGFLYNKKNSVSHYFNLYNENQKLIEENLSLKLKILDKENQDFKERKFFNIIEASIINNQYTRTNNFFTIRKGKNQNIEIDDGLINDKGVSRIINNTSNNYSTALSILNSEIRINAKLKNSNHFGTIKWNTKKVNIVQLQDIPRTAKLKVGDTIVTNGMGSIFPKNIDIGFISEFELMPNNYFNINVELFNDMTDLSHVYIIKNSDRKEIKTLEEHNE